MTFNKGYKPWHSGTKGMINNGFKKGEHISPKTEFKKGERLGKSHPNWKGNKVKYSGIHMWVRSKLGYPEICECCGKSGLKGRQICWANIDHTYKRDLNDWGRLCVSCHRKFDNIFN